ncbi:efflux RND transporter periplasmic adaptor subunit [Microbulbifer hainanensis]|uniref:efflux RND transporter periplasmic adaptor subunit n=1 Tax=Microbulbifer hainanensis TaxID=2735675 RepID=UPI0018691739|nr:HlyD family secretion protein [Microbulbifer hainanensis]
MGKLLRVGVTLAVVAVAIVAGIWVWNYYLYSPWTRDGRVRADVIIIAPDVSGWVTQLAVRNHQKVNKGDLLFTIDDTRFIPQIAEAEALVEQKRVAWELAKHQDRRRRLLPARQVISEEDLDIYRIQAEAAKASYDLALAQLNSARIDLQRTRVVAPESGTISNLTLREGNYVTRATSVLSLVKKNSFYVTGYFEETKLQLVHVGQAARIRLMGDSRTLSGKVTSIAKGIADINTNGNQQLLPEVQQTFNWVRLAQRIPVDIELEPVPEDVNISAGMTVSIYLEHE